MCSEAPPSRLESFALFKGTSGTTALVVGKVEYEQSLRPVLAAGAVIGLWLVVDDLVVEIEAATNHLVWHQHQLVVINDLPGAMTLYT